ncbi:GGDEF domain-containing protein [Anaerosalibacter massiliensis]|uniref:GGDEF domain-containing protein n=1 Tax=Anaerosalibacter massiliensis TaxID=1347392 RepID=A0A9X2S512_9FIRM|nr:GGDEF domain-containing protein [Anaerosalibacter massiliensis]MCR2043844.1 GGDEF domain-containing protein [Anaerosalibacter massiliensis]
MRGYIVALLSVFGMFIGFIFLLNIHIKSEGCKKVYCLFISLGVLSYILSFVYLVVYYNIFLEKGITILGWHNIFYLSYYILFIIGNLYLISKIKNYLISFKILLDILIITVLISTIIFKFYIESMTYGQNLSYFLVVILIFYTTASLGVLLHMLSIFFISDQIFPLKAVKILIIGLSLKLIVDSIYLYDHLTQNSINFDYLCLFWTLSLLLFILGIYKIETISFNDISMEQNSKRLIKNLVPYFVIIILLIIIFRRINNKDILIFGFAIVILLILIRQIIICIEDIRLYEKIDKYSKTDFLTGLYNRRYIDREIEEFLQKYKNTEKKASLLMVDIDHFKLINDTYGHDIGDRVLKEISNIMKESIRKNDILIRFGGEEFIFFLPDTDIKMAQIIGERLRSKIENHQFKCNKNKILVTISIGISEEKSIREKDDIYNMIVRADKALYEAKKSGRNCIFCKR